MHFWLFSIGVGNRSTDAKAAGVLALIYGERNSLIPRLWIDNKCSYGHEHRRLACSTTLKIKNLVGDQAASAIRFTKPLGFEFAEPVKQRRIHRNFGCHCRRRRNIQCWIRKELRQ